MFNFIKLLPVLFLFVGVGNVIDETSSTSVSISIPNIVEAGKFFDVEVEITKGNSSDFARFVQKLPSGLYATSLESSNSAFYFTDGEARFIWMKLPNTEKIKVKYRVYVNERLKGSFEVKGGFYYLSKDKSRNTVDLESSFITINPNPNTPLASLVDVNDFKTDSNIFEIKNANQGLLCMRQKPILNTDGSYDVNIIVNRGSLTSFTKIVEDIPPGFSVREIELQGATFQFKNQQAKFLWKILPQQTQFVISYKVVPEDSNSMLYEYKGYYSYIENNATVTLPVVEKNLNVKTATSQQLELAFAEARTITQASVINSNNLLANNNTKSNNLSNNKIGSQSSSISKDNKKDKNSVVSVGKNRVVELNNMLEPEKGLYYRVQIAASKSPINVKQAFSKLNLRRDIKCEINNCWYKYSVGSFPVYRDVKRYRDLLWKEKGITDAFVTAYSNGKRITIQEALIASHHEWIK